GWKDGSALYWFFQQDRIVTDFGVWVRTHLPFGVLRAMTYGALAVEGSLSVLILFPFFQRWTRRVVLVLVWTLHGMIAASARIGPFSYAMMLFPVLLLGADDWALVTRPFRSQARRRTVILDGRSALSFGLARLLDRLDPFDRLTFVDRRQTDLVPVGIPTDPFLVLNPEGRTFRHARALREVTRALPFGGLFRFILRLPFVAGYVASKARAFDEREGEWGEALGITRKAKDPATARLVEPHAPPPVRAGIASALGSLREACVVLLGVAVLTALAEQNVFVSSRLRVRPSEWMVELVEYPRLLQGWSMFAPEPPYEDGRVVVDGRTADGRKYDPFADGTPSFDPEAPRGFGHSQFWCDYHNRIRYRDNAHHRQHLQNYLLHQHELSGHPENRLVAFEVWWIRDRSPSPGEHHGHPLPPEKLLSYGTLKDSGVAPWLGPLQAEQPGRGHDVPLRGP
ncbi:MAG TPA: hypothetical protein VGQ57_21435, partial [Polyangiaceae bacterium]|nr:hypothetical protein [Polyangiaceae bacterium]